MGTKTFFIASAIMLIVVGAALILFKKPQTASPGTVLPAWITTVGGMRGKLISVINYTCDSGKRITAGYYEGAPAPEPQPGKPPVPTGFVEVLFGDKTDMTLKQTISADGARYANPDESFVFWSKGKGAMVLENGKEQDYTNCVGNTAP